MDATRRRRREIGLAGCLLGLLLLSLAGPPPSRASEHFRRCGTDAGLRVEIQVFRVTCAKARRIVKAYLDAEPGLPITPVKGFPAWKCSTGDRAGSCARGKYASGVPEILFAFLEAPGRVASAEPRPGPRRH